MRPSAVVALFLPCSLLLAQDPPKVDFVQQVAPILQQHCVECHGQKKVKGKLRLDRKDGLFVADADKWVVIPGKPADSEMIRRVMLPAGDDDVMPQKGEPLLAAQIEVLRRWIEAGADWPQDGDDYFAQRAPVETPKLEVEALDADGKARVDAALQELQELGATAQRIAKDSDAVDVNLSLLGDKVTDAQLAALADLAPVLVWLNLGRTKVTDAAMAGVAQLRQLRRLHLENTGIGDAGLLPLAKLAQLDYLNLYGSKVTDQGLAALAGMKVLRQLFVWQTAVTDQGVAALQQQLPQLRIDRGDYAEARQQAAQQQIEQRAQKAPVNEACPVTGKPVDASTGIDFAGLRIAFCCPKCREEFTADPKRFQAQLDGYKQKAAVPPPEPKKQ